MSEPETLDLSIDPLRLDEEWVVHPSIYARWAMKLAEAQALYDERKSSYDVVSAQVGQDVRENPAAFNLMKVTADAVSEAITLDPRTRTSNQLLNQAKKNLLIAKAAVDALEHKKRALTVLADLWIKEYYSDMGMPKLDHLSSDEKRAIRRRAQTRQERSEDDSASD